MRAHGHANRGTGICNAMAKMAYSMQHGLILTWESLSHTHMRGRWMKVKCLEMRAHGHANRGNGIRNAMAWKMTCKYANGISALKYGGNQPRYEAKVRPMLGIVPSHGLLAPEMAYSYTKHAQYGHGAWRQKQNSFKISIFLVQVMAKQQAKIGQQWHAKMALNMRLWSNSRMLTPNRLGPFNNIEEEPKIRLFTVYGSPKNSIQIY